jgi:predicted Na+-dependent transporter
MSHHANTIAGETITVSIQSIALTHWIASLIHLDSASVVFVPAAVVEVVLLLKACHDIGQVAAAYELLTSIVPVLS